MAKKVYRLHPFDGKIKAMYDKAPLHINRKMFKIAEMSPLVEVVNKTRLGNFELRFVLPEEEALAREYDMENWAWLESHLEYSNEEIKLQLK